MEDPVYICTKMSVINLALAVLNDEDQSKIETFIQIESIYIHMYRSFFLILVSVCQKSAQSHQVRIVIIILYIVLKKCPFCIYIHIYYHS